MTTSPVMSSGVSVSPITLPMPSALLLRKTLGLAPLSNLETLIVSKIAISREVS